MTHRQFELLAVPTPTAAQPGRCWLPTRNGARRPCPNAAAGMVRDWLAPLDPSQAIPACAGCARVFGCDLDSWV